MSAKKRLTPSAAKVGTMLRDRELKLNEMLMRSSNAATAAMACSTPDERSAAVSDFLTSTIGVSKMAGEVRALRSAFMMLAPQRAEKSQEASLAFSDLDG